MWLVEYSVQGKQRRELQREIFKGGVGGVNPLGKNRDITQYYYMIPIVVCRRLNMSPVRDPGYVVAPSAP